MYKITSIQQAKKRGTRVNIYLDNDFWIGLDKNDLIAFGLFRNKDITETEKKEIEEAAGFNKLLEKAINYTQVRQRSEREMFQYLTFKRSLPPEEAQKIIDKLVEKNYLDDKRFTEWYVDNRLAFGTHGENKIFAELLKKGINSRLAKEVLKQKISPEAEEEISEKIKTFAQKALRTIKAENEFQRNQKLIQKLLARGYKYSDIKKALRDSFSAFD